MLRRTLTSLTLLFLALGSHAADPKPEPKPQPKPAPSKPEPKPDPTKPEPKPEPKPQPPQPEPKPQPAPTPTKDELPKPAAPTASKPAEDSKPKKKSVADFTKDFKRIDWKHGIVFVPTEGLFHQHFNTNPTPARYLAIALGSMRYPFTASKRNLFAGGVDTSVEKGGNQIEFEHQDKRIHGIYLTELKKNGVKSNMADQIDETQYGDLLVK